jgi:hypothetical protein
MIRLFPDIEKSGSIDVNRFITEVSTDKIGVGHTWFTEEMKKVSSLATSATIALVHASSDPALLSLCSSHCVQRAGVGSQMKGERVTELVMIVDIANLGLSARKLVKIFSLTSYIDQNFLPEYSQSTHPHAHACIGTPIPSVRALAHSNSCHTLCFVCSGLPVHHQRAFLLPRHLQSRQGIPERRDAEEDQNSQPQVCSDVGRGPWS